MVKVAIFGISGYAGQKLLDILIQHPEVKVTLGFVAPNEKPENVSRMYGRVAKILNFECKNKIDWAAVEKLTDCAFLALPHAVSMEFVPKLLEMRKKVIDLSADYRFSDVSTYEKWYQKHTSPQLLERAVYGLPEINRQVIKSADLIANPGCYPTSALLALIPLAKEGLICGDIIVNSLSGYTGAGKKPDIAIIFPEGNENSRAYKIAEHRHQPEIEHILEKCAQTAHSVTFVPHLIPLNCGILSTIYLDLTESVPEEKLQAKFTSFYEKEPFVRIMDYGVSPQIKNIVGTNFCDIGIKKSGPNKLVIVSAIDNLVKGASGQAVQNMNIMYGFPETLPFYR